MPLSGDRIKQSELRRVVKDSLKTRYAPRAVKDKFRELGITSDYKSVSRKEAEAALLDLKGAGVIGNKASEKKLAQTAFSGAEISGKPKKLLGSVARRLPQKTSYKDLKKLIAWAGKKSYVGQTKAVKEILKAAGITAYPYRKIKREQVVDIINKLQRKGLVKGGLTSRLKKDWQVYEKFLKSGAAGGEARYLGARFLPITMDRYSFLHHLESVGGKAAVLRAKVIMREWSYDAHDELGRKQVEKVLRRMQNEGVIGRTFTKEPIGKQIAKKESLRKAWVAMGIAEEDEVGGRYRMPEERLPEGVARTVAGGTEIRPGLAGESREVVGTRKEEEAPVTNIEQLMKAKKEADEDKLSDPLAGAE